MLGILKCEAKGLQALKGVLYLSLLTSIANLPFLLLRTRLKPHPSTTPPFSEGTLISHLGFHTGRGVSMGRVSFCWESRAFSTNVKTRSKQHRGGFSE